MITRTFGIIDATYDVNAVTVILTVSRLRAHQAGFQVVPPFTKRVQLHGLREIDQTFQNLQRPATGFQDNLSHRVARDVRTALTDITNEMKRGTK